MSFARARALAIVGVLVVAALVLVVTAIVRDRQSSASFSPGGCGPGKIKIDTRLPDQSAVKLNVFNGTGQRNPNTKDKAHPIINAVPNLAEQVSDDLKNRGFKISKVDSNPQKFTGVARLSYGPKMVAGAVVVRAYFLNEADQGGFDIKRTDDTVDVLLGSGFKQLGSKTDVNGMFAEQGKPSPPPGTCDGNA
jgi:LytR cell envelope-related transcriptional attenuator